MSVSFLSKGQTKKRIEILDVSHQDLYSQEPLSCIALKMAGLFFFANPLYFSLYAAIQTIRVFTIPSIHGLSFFTKEFIHAISVPFFYIGMQFAALMGMVRPLDGRALFGKIERMLHDGKERRDAEQYQDESRPLKEVLYELFCAKNPKTALFVGFCMQPISKLNAPHILHYEEPSAV